jgi:hypothetical protein
MSIFTLDDVNELKKAIAQGVRKVEYADKKVEYKSNAEMFQALRMMQDDLGLIPENGGRANGIFEKGLNCGDNEHDILFFD